MSIEIEICSPTTLPEADIQACLSLIRDGKAVSLRSAAEELPQARLVAVARDGENIVGVGALKRVRVEYAFDIAQKSGFRFNTHLHELGYVAVRPSHRGQRISKRIAATLLAQLPDQQFFATTSDPYMKRSLTSAGFANVGSEWRGTRGKLLSLWLTAENRDGRPQTEKNADR